MNVRLYESHTELKKQAIHKQASLFLPEHRRQSQTCFKSSIPDKRNAPERRNPSKDHRPPVTLLTG
jgi:hypothetical protein